jgi:DNA-binding SARP family transcriptional activator
VHRPGFRAATFRQQPGKRCLAWAVRLRYVGLNRPTSTARMDFRILGPLEALDGDERVALGGSKRRAVLAVLLLHANETLTTDRLVDELWGERPPAAAAKTVQVHISRLRRALAGAGAADLLVTREHGYELVVDPERIDARRFERLVSEGRSDLSAGNAEAALGALERAIALWRGPPLADLAYEPFVQREAAHLEELRVTALEQLVEAKLATGRHGEVIGQLEQLIEEHPYRENLRAQLMLALYRADRQADALQVYQDTRRTLVEELGIEPGERLRQLERAILAQDAELHLVAEPPAAAEPAVEAPRSAFVGRERELAELVAGLDDAFAGSGRLFLLAGEPGIGKSRLADEVIRQARARGARVLVGRCWEAGGAPAYWPWVQSLRAYVRGAEPDALRAQLGAGAADLAQFLPELRERFPDLPEPPSMESEAARFRLFDAAAEFVRRASESRPIVLVLDDLHAADAPSLLLLRFLARQLGSTRILLLCAYRDVDPLLGQPLTEMLVEVAREPVTSHLPLGGLSKGEVAEYVELTAPEIASPGLLAALDAETEGNPLFVGEIVRLLSVEGVRAESTAELRLALPQSVRDVIARRLAHLSEECNRMLVLAAVLGREFALDALARLAGVPEDELLDVLDEAMAARVVSDVPGAPDRLRFAHVLIRDTLYEGLTAARRKRLHRLAVDALVALRGDDPSADLAEIAHHCVAGSDFGRGLAYARRAGDQAFELLAYEESARLYAMALEALRHAEDGDERDRCELLLSLGEAEARAGDSQAAKAVFLEAAEIARRLGVARELARAAAGYGGRIAWARAGDDHRLVPLLEEGLAALGDGDADLRSRLLGRLAGALRDEPSRERRDALSAEAVAIARASGDDPGLAYALEARGIAVLAPDTVAECLTLADELAAVAARHGDTERLVNAHMHRFLLRVMTGDVDGVEAELAAAGRAADESRQPVQAWQVRAARAMLALTAGRLDEAEGLIADSLALGERAQPEMAIPVHRLQRYTLCDLRDTLAELEPRLHALVAEYPARVMFRCALLHLQARLGRAGEAKRALRELARDGFAALPFDQEWLYGMSFLAEAAALLGDADSAAGLYPLLLPWSGFNAVDHPEGFRGSTSRYLGMLAAATGRLKDAERHFEHAIAMDARMGARPWLAFAHHDYARMLLARGEPRDGERALKLIREAVPTYRKLGMESWAERASELERAPRVAAAPGR